MEIGKFFTANIVTTSKTHNFLINLTFNNFSLYAAIVHQLLLEGVCVGIRTCGKRCSEHWSNAIHKCNRFL